MLWTQFKLMFRSLWKNKLYSAIIIFGLAIAVTLILLLSSYVSNEISVDAFHVNGERIYRVRGDKIETFAPPFGQFILKNVPEAESYTRVWKQTGTITFKGQKFDTGNCLLVDSTFFTMFSFPLATGDASRMLEAKESAVLSETFSKVVFGNENPVGESFEYNGIRITGTVLLPFM